MLTANMCSAPALIGFPGTRHDNQVDSTTQALDYLREPDFLAIYLKAYS
jgi:phage terminase large subunit-like protein